MLASSMRYVKRNYWSIHGSSLAALQRPVNVAAWIQIHAALCVFAGEGLEVRRARTDDGPHVIARAAPALRRERAIPKEINAGPGSV